MTFVYITDTHLKDTAPSCRKDNYAESILAKMGEVIELANLLGAEVLHGGDFFDSPRVDLGLIIKVIYCLRGLKRKLMIVSLGNHEWRGKWDDWKKRSPLYLLETLGLVRLSTQDENGTQFLMPLTKKCTIHMIHKQLVEKPVPWDHTLFKDYDGPGDMILVSDYHPFQGHKFIKKGKREIQFVAPGALARTSRNDTDVTRHPCAAVIVPADPPKVTFYKIKCAAPAEDIYSDVEVDTTSVKRQTFDEAIEHLKDLGNKIKVYSIVDLLQIVAKLTNARDEVKELCRSRLSR